MSPKGDSYRGGGATAAFAHGTHRSFRLLTQHLSLLDREVDSARARESLGMMRFLVEDMELRLTRAVLREDLERMAGGEFSANSRFAPSAVEPAQILAAIQRALRRRSSLAQVAARCTHSGFDRTTRVLITDWHLFEVVIDELVENACRYGAHDGHAAIRAVLETSTSEVCLRISDEGRGIAASDAAQVFEDGFRGTHARLRSPSGLGQGLFLARAACLALSIGLRLSNAAEAEFEIILVTDDRAR